MDGQFCIREEMKDKRKILIENGWEPVMDGDLELWLDPEDETRNDPSLLKQAWDNFRRARFMENKSKKLKESQGLTLNRDTCSQSNDISIKATPKLFGSANSPKNSTTDVRS